MESSCINYDCKSGKGLVLAPGWCLTYYKIKEQKKRQEICSDCFDEAFEFNKNIINKLEQNEYLIEQNYPIRHDLEIIDSDEEVEDLEYEHEVLPKEQQEFIENNFVEAFNDVLQKFKFEEQVKYSETYLTDKMNNLKSKSKFSVVLSLTNLT